MDPLSNPAYLIFAAISPLLIALVKQQGFSRQVNAVIALVCYVLFGVAGALMSGEALTLENAMPLIAVMTVVGTAVYNLLWSNLGSSTETDPSLDEKLTDATSIVR